MAEPSDNSTKTPSDNSLLPTSEGIVIDIGTGDGHFVYRCARQNPKRFYIGIDANPRPLRKTSEKIHRKPKKGGAANALFLQASIEDLPRELDGIADEIHIHFPWGSLLRAIALGDAAVLGNLRRLCSPEALLEVIISLDPERDRSEIERLGLPVLSAAYIDSVLTPRFRDANLQVVERGECSETSWPELQTSWGKRLKGGSNRSLVYIIAQAVK